MGLADELRDELDSIKEELGLDRGGDAPVEGEPDEEFVRQVSRTAYVRLLLRWVTRLATEIDEIRATTRGGQNPRD